MSPLPKNIEDALPIDPTPAPVGPVTPGTGATNLGKAEDAPHASGDVGVEVLAVRQDVAAPLAGNGDYIPLTTDANGNLRVTGGGLTDAELRATPVPVSGTVTATGPLTDAQLRATAVPVSGPLTDAQLRATAVPVSGPLTDAQLRATAVPVSGPLTDAQLRAAPVPVSGAVTATGPLTDAQLRATAVPVSGPLTDAQLRATAVPVSGPLTDAQLRATAVPVSGPLTDAQLRATAVPVSVSSQTPGTGATNLGKAEDAVHASGDVGVLALAVAQNMAAPAVLVSASGDYCPIGVDTEGSGLTIGNRQHDAADSGAPVKVGQKAIAFGASPTAVAAADRTDWYANRHGIPFVIGGHMNAFRKEWVFTAAQTNLKILTVGGGNKIVVTEAEALVDNDGTVAVQVRLGLAQTTLTAISNNSATGIDGLLISHPDIAPGSGVVVGNGSGIIAAGVDGDDLILTCDAATGGSLRILVTGFIIES